MALMQLLLTALFTASAVAYDGVTEVGEISIYDVTVDLESNTFDPPAVTAKVDDIIRFRFYPAGEHSVIESLYRWPCVPKAAVNGQEGFYFDDVKDTLLPHYTFWNLTITTLDPIFYYCGAEDYCTGRGVVGAINPGENQNIFKQQELAKAAQVRLLPHETLDPDRRASITAAAERIMGVEDTLTPIAIAGIVIGGVVVLILKGAIVVYIRRRRKWAREIRANLEMAFAHNM